MSDGIFYKAVRPDGRAFFDAEFPWIPHGKPLEGHVVKHRMHRIHRIPTNAEADRYLSVATLPTACTGLEWPCRLFTVIPISGYPVISPSPLTMPYKRGARAWQIVEELDSSLVFGPQAKELLAFIERAANVTVAQVNELAKASHEHYIRIIQAESVCALNRKVTGRDVAYQLAQDVHTAKAFASSGDDAQPKGFVALGPDYYENASRYAALRSIRSAISAIMLQDVLPEHEYRVMTHVWNEVMNDNL